MKNLFFVFIMLMSLQLMTENAHAAKHEMQIFKGEVLSHEGKKAIIGKRFLQDKERFHVTEKSVVRVTDTEGLQGYIYGPADFTYYSNKDIDPKILLKEGMFRWDAKGSAKLVISTGLTETATSEGVYIVQSNPHIPKVDWWVIRGALLVRGYGQDSFHAIKDFERTSFVGENEGGIPVYDTLLHGTRVVRGKLTGIEKFPETDIANLEKTYPWMKKPGTIKQKVVIRLPDQICERPFGRLNECVWKAEKSQCYRERCLANGQWGDRQQVKIEPRCSENPKPAPCGY